MEAAGAKHWFSERRLHQAGFSGHCPDAIFQLGRNRCALELELSLKNLERYPKVFQGYAQMRDRLDAVLYVCGSAKVRDAIAKQVVIDPARYYFALWPDFAKHGAQTEFASKFDRARLAEMI
jgi:hypothetical protein